MKLIKELLDGATALGACRKTDGIDTLDRLIALYKSPQGMEFCTRHNYPSREQWTQIASHWSREELQQRHIYIDEQRPMVVFNPGTVVVVGSRLHATFAGADAAQRVIALHDASVKICADNYAVFSVDNDGTADVAITKDSSSIQL